MSFKQINSLPAGSIVLTPKHLRGFLILSLGAGLTFQFAFWLLSIVASILVMALVFGAGLIAGAWYWQRRVDGAIEAEFEECSAPAPTYRRGRRS